MDDFPAGLIFTAIVVIAAGAVLAFIVWPRVRRQAQRWLLRPAARKGGRARRSLKRWWLEE
jgi:hypothetical protein